MWSQWRDQRLLLWAVYVLLMALGLWKHEMWLDELQVWQIAKASPSLGDIFPKIRYEGHPGLWQCLIWVLTRFCDDPQSMKVLQWLFVASYSAIFLRCAPFSIRLKALFLFSYLFVYDYALFSRNYAVEIVLLFMACVLVQKDRTWALGIVLFLLCQSMVLGVFFVIAMLGYILLNDYWRGIRSWQSKHTILSLFIGLGIAACLWQIVPPADTGYAVGWHLTPYSNLPKAVTSIARTFVPIPLHEQHFWQTIWIHGAGLKLAIAAVVLLCIGIELREKPAALFFFFSVTLACVFFFYTKHFGGIRHHGHIFLGFIAAWWLKEYAVTKQSNCSRTVGFLAKYMPVVFSSILCLHVYAGAYAYVREWREPFSRSQEVAAYIQAHHWEEKTLIGVRDKSVSAIAGFLGKPMLYVNCRCEGTYIIWNTARVDEVSEKETISFVREQVRKEGKEVLLVSNKELSILPKGFSVEQRFSPAINSSEEFVLYRIK